MTTAKPSRYHKDWLKAYIKYAGFSEAPRHMHFWTGVSTIAGALRRKVWIDMGYFQWYPNFYIIFVAPPGIVQKSTTAGIGMSMLREIPGINFGPDVVTWPALVECFAASAETFSIGADFHTMSAITLESSEFGNLLDPTDRSMVDLLVHLWDGKQGCFKKQTKSSGNDCVENPWINILACTTPSWIAGHFPEYMIGGGFTSRCVFVYADAKEKFVAYPFRMMRDLNMEDEKRKLVADLGVISEFKGPYQLSDEAQEWGEAWYENHYTNRPDHLADERFGGYLARKQSHMHKLSIILAASTTDQPLISLEHLQIADSMVSDLEQDMLKVFSGIGKSNTSLQVDRLVDYVRVKGRVQYQEVYQYIHAYFPSARDFEDVLAGCIKSGILKLYNNMGLPFLEYVEKKDIKRQLKAPLTSTPTQPDDGE